MKEKYMSEEEYRINMNQLNVIFITKHREQLVETMCTKNILIVQFQPSDKQANLINFMKQ